MLKNLNNNIAQMNVLDKPFVVCVRCNFNTLDTCKYLLLSNEILNIVVNTELQLVVEKHA